MEKVRFLGSLVAAYTVVWMGLLLYVVRLTRRTRQVEDELEALRKLHGR